MDNICQSHKSSEVFTCKAGPKLELVQHQDGHLKTDTRQQNDKHNCCASFFLDKDDILVSLYITGILCYGIVCFMKMLD